MYPLHTRVCGSCFLVQVDDVVPADAHFNQDYAYFSSFSQSWLEHCQAFANASSARFGLDDQSLVVEIASNDGYLLQYFLEKGIRVLGVEPSASVAKVAQEKGIETRVEFFGDAYAGQLRREGLKPDLICSANVLAHVPDIGDFVAGVATLLSDEGVYTVEFPHLLNLINLVQFDTIYHEHYTYLSLVAVERIFRDKGLRVFDVEEIPTHGGSLRVYACRNDAAHEPTQRVDAVRAKEAAAKLDSLEGYQGFSTKVETLRTGLLAYLQEAKAAGRRVAGYGAAAKGNTLLNYCGIDADLIAYVVDKNPAKQNTLLPGSRIPVHAVEELYTQRPDDILILPWNIRDEVISQLADLRRQGTRFVTAVPHIDIIE